MKIIFIYIDMERFLVFIKRKKIRNLQNRIFSMIFLKIICLNYADLYVFLRIYVRIYNYSYKKNLKL